MHRFSLGLIAFIALAFATAGLAHAQAQTAGCTPPPGTGANQIVCFGSTPCPPGYIDPVGLPARYAAANLLTRWLCQMPVPDVSSSSSSSSSTTTTTVSIPPVSGSVSLPLTLTTSTSGAPPTAGTAPQTTNTTPPSTASRPAAPAAATATTTVLVGSSDTLGAFLTNPQGMTLYTRNLDTAGTSTCTGSCSVIWLSFAPPSTALSLPGNATGSLGLIIRDDGSQQVIYNGMPLYLYTGDFKPGDTNGDGLAGIYSVALP